MRLASIIALGLLSTSSAAFAQLKAPVERQVNIQAATTLTYDSNVFNTNPATQHLFGKGGSDIRATPSLDFDVVLPVSRQSVYAHGTVGYDFYKRNHRLNRERIGVDAGANLDMAGCAPNLNVSYSRAQSNFADIFTPTNNGNVETRTTMGGSAVCGGPLGLQAGASYSHTESRNSGAFFDRQSYNSDTIGANVGYIRPTFGVLSLYGNYTTTSYLNRRFLVPGVGIINDGIETYAAGVEFQRNIGSRISGSVSLGYTWVRPKLPISPRFNGASYGADITLMPTEGFQVGLSAGRDISASNLLDVSYTITDLYSLSGTYALGQSLTLTFDASHRSRKLRGPAVVQGLVLQDDKVISGGVGLRYRMNERLMFDTNFVQERRDSDALFQRYHDSRVSFGVSLRL